jgi:hypothetical protein
MTKQSGIFAIDKVQRLCYVSALILWLVIWKEDFRFYDLPSSLGIKYIWLISIPAILLLLQAILNNIILWRTLFGLLLMYTSYAVIVSLMDIFERSGNHVKAIPWDLKTFLFFMLIFGLLLLVNLILYKLKPIGKTKKKHNSTLEQI